MEEHRQKIGARRRGSFRVGAALLALAALAAGILWWRRINTLPPYAMPRPQAPQPNALDFYLCAADAFRTVAGQDAVRARSTSADYLAYVLERSRPALETYQAGRRHPYLAPLPDDSLLYQFEYLRCFGAIAAVLTAQSRVAADINDMQGALARIAEVLRLGGQVARGGILTHAEEGRVVEQMGLAELAMLGGDLSAGQCRQALRLLDEADRERVPLAEAITRERDLVHEFLFRVSRRDPDAFALLDLILRRRWSSGPRMLYLWNPRGALRDLEQAAAQAVRESPLPAGRRHALTVRHPLIERLRSVDRQERAIRQEDARKARLRLLQADLALRAYRLEHGRPASALADLVPGYLPELPTDPYGSGEPLRWRPGPEPLVYSIGPDQADDGGRHAHWRSISWPHGTPRGDLTTHFGEYDLWRPARAQWALLHQALDSPACPPYNDR